MESKAEKAKGELESFNYSAIKQVYQNKLGPSALQQLDSFWPVSFFLSCRVISCPSRLIVMAQWKVSTEFSKIFLSRNNLSLLPLQGCLTGGLRSAVAAVLLR